MNIAIPKEVYEGERRVACTPDEVARLAALGHGVLVERAAGQAAGFADEAYTAAGATTVDDAAALWQQGEVVCKVRPPRREEVAMMRAGQILISFLQPAQNEELLAQIAARGATALAVEAVPRISRAQKLDALSSMASIAGYRAVIESGQHFERFFAGQITAAGTIPAAEVLVIGAGVAGLSAIGTAVSLGASVRAFDTRAEVREQIESLGARFLSLDFTEQGGGGGGYGKAMSDEFLRAEHALFARHAAEVDIIITTALIPGKPAPVLITAEMVASMRRGGVVVDLAAEQGGNCALTTPGQVAEHHGITVIGYTDFPNRMAPQASRLYAANLRHLITELTPEGDGRVVVDLEDEVIRATTVVHDGERLAPPPPAPPPAAAAAPKASVDAAPAPSGTMRRRLTMLGAAATAGALIAIGAVAPPSLMNHLIVFVLACFVGWQVIWNVTPALHTPLMSVTNAISSIIIIGALLQVGAPHWTGRALALIAVLLAAINITGGFTVTRRMLHMFRKAP